MYRTMQQHWIENGPPVYISVAAFLGHKPPPPRDDSGLIQDPAALAAYLSNVPGGHVA